ncbi:MAG: hypothetical protein ACRDOH_22435, partial [Streptosporangiaceae bacterium]
MSDARGQVETRICGGRSGQHGAGGGHDGAPRGSQSAVGGTVSPAVGVPGIRRAALRRRLR